VLSARISSNLIPKTLMSKLSSRFHATTPSIHRASFHGSNPVVPVQSVDTNSFHSLSLMDQVRAHRAVPALALALVQLAPEVLRLDPRLHRPLHSRGVRCLTYSASAVVILQAAASATVRGLVMQTVLTKLVAAVSQGAGMSRWIERSRRRSLAVDVI